MKKIARRTFLASIPAAGLSLTLTPSLLASIPNTTPKTHEVPIKFDGIYLGDVLNVYSYIDETMTEHPQFVGDGLLCEHEMYVPEGIMSWAIFKKDGFMTGQVDIINNFGGYYIKLPPTIGDEKYRDDWWKYDGSGQWSLV